MKGSIDMCAHMTAEFQGTGHVAVRPVKAVPMDFQGLLVAGPLGHVRHDGVRQIDQFQRVNSWAPGARVEGMRPG